ncbi:MAG: hypothetical protein MJ095_06100 [Oscillospiraceae bacterium]|nr:hypothetical protein [Oscillospiraceae bacterium]
MKIAFDLPENGGTLVAVISENTLYYNNTEDIPRLYRRRGLFSRSVGVQSPTERKQFFELPLLVKSRALKNAAGREFVSWPESMDAVIENIPFGSFIESGTAIDTVMTRIEKKQQFLSLRYTE